MGLSAPSETAWAAGTKVDEDGCPSGVDSTPGKDGPGTGWPCEPGTGGPWVDGAPSGTTDATVALTAVDTGALTSGVLRGITRAPEGGTGWLVRWMRAAASALTRCSNSLARSGARPAHSRKRLISRACENASNDSNAIPNSAAKPAMAPTSVKELESESPSDKAFIALLSKQGCS